MDRIVQILIPELMKQFLQFLFSKKTFLLPDSFLGTLLRFAILWPAQSSCDFFMKAHENNKIFCISIRDHRIYDDFRFFSVALLYVGALVQYRFPTSDFAFSTFLLSSL